MISRLLPHGLAPVLTALLLVAAAPAQAGLIGVQWGGDVLDIDPATGVGAPLGASGFFSLNSAASDSTGTVYAVSETLLSGDSFKTSTVITIDPTTGAGTAASPSFASQNGVRGIGFSPGGDLYAVIDTGPLFGTGVDGLYRIDIATGTLTPIGLTGLIGIQGLAFAADGTLYGYDFLGVGLVTIDTTTGIATDVNAAIGGGTDVQALEFGPDGTLYGGRGTLYTIDPATGALTAIGGNVNGDVRGLAFVPEPGTLAVFGIGLAGLGFLRRRRKS